MSIYKKETLVIEGVGEVSITTVNFPTVTEAVFKDGWIEDGQVQYLGGFESMLTLPNGKKLGHGPEEVGETPESLHASWTPEEIWSAWQREL